MGGGINLCSLSQLMSILRWEVRSKVAWYMMSITAAPRSFSVAVVTGECSVSSQLVYESIWSYRLLCYPGQWRNTVFKFSGNVQIAFDWIARAPWSLIFLDRIHRYSRFSYAYIVVLWFRYTYYSYNNKRSCTRRSSLSAGIIQYCAWCCNLGLPRKNEKVACSE